MAPGRTNLLLHATSSWLAGVFSIVHAILLLPDNYVPYRLVDIVVPFIGQYRQLAVGLGVLGMWLTPLINISLSMRKLIGQKA